MLLHKIILHLNVLEHLQKSYTCTEMKDSPIILVPYDVKVSDTSDDIQDEQLDETVPFTISALTADIREQSSKLYILFRNQCFLTGELLKGNVVERYHMHYKSYKLYCHCR